MSYHRNENGGFIKKKKKKGREIWATMLSSLPIWLLAQPWDASESPYQQEGSH